ncbi:putative tryptophan N-monooxygenase [Helianthus annuus]|uniref:Tryptophan N-monooxygenase n=1 Tax=Helianthus annuus TaxID=4232 RepID=A0A9K3IUL6_HELAN|nr:putative tryptophan N-monooxygenase [Helianthus annuus]KAJ0574130.1 putative tryptophan N-monooxygenase [Helianthus annuus]KAJ0738464.1 putative tryptophan N-monooxygenase [Helianthus annuus]KAJ0741350.1 putative tryptophan N-monooxygenase [Helianthus annuus]KAJ0912594.1 putative tryptophan N-monooxygenase [Helianthus annuus]
MFSFSMGRRGCPGALLGSTMTTMSLSSVIQGFTWTLPSNEPHVYLKENLHDLVEAKPLFVLAKSLVCLNIFILISEMVSERLKYDCDLLK